MLEYHQNMKTISYQKELNNCFGSFFVHVGYLDNNYFVKVLKKKYGLTPSEYRNQARQQKENKKDPYGSCFLNGDPRDLNPRPSDYDSL